MTGRSKWSRLIRNGLLGYGLVLAGQLLSACAGLVFVNVLTTEEFAVFAVCTSLLQAIIAQSDLGTLAAVGYFYREKPDAEVFQKATLPAIAELRLKFFLAAATLLTIFFVAIDPAQGASPLRTAVLLMLTLAVAWLGMANALQTVVLRVRGDWSKAVAIEALAGCVRLVLALAMLTMQPISAEGALFTTLSSAAIVFTAGRHYARDVPILVVRQPDKDERRSVFRYTLPLIPGSLYYTLQPSILIWVSMIFGNAQLVAEVGALGRIGQIISFVGFGLNLFVLPHLANLRDERAFRRVYGFIWLIVFGASAAALLAIVPSRNIIIILLGPNYVGLGDEVVLVAGTALLNVAAQYAVIVNRVRGWNKLEPFSTVALFLGQVGLVALLPLNSTAGILWFGLLYAAWVASVNVAINVVGFLRPVWATDAYQLAHDAAKEKQGREL